MSGLLGRRKTTLSQQSQILSGVRIQTSLYGSVIPLVYGWNRISGNLIWYGDFNKQKAQNPAGGGKGGLTGGGGKGSGTQYNYFASVQIALCEGPIFGIGRIWDSQGNLPLNQAQEPFIVPGGGGSYQVAHFQNFVADAGTAREDLVSTTVTDPGSPGPITLGGFQLTPMILVPSSPVAGQYTLNFGSGTYTFGAADAGKTVLVNYVYSTPSTDTSGIPIQQLNYTLFNGARPQTPWGYLTTNHSAQALGYTGLAYLAQANMPLGSSGMLPNQSFEIYGIYQFGGGIQDANPKDFIVDFTTNPLYGAGLAFGDLGDLSSYSNYCVANGLFISPVIDQQRAAADWLKEVLEATNSEAVWSGGRLKIIPYGDQTAVGNGATYIPNTQPIFDLTDDDFIAQQGTDPVLITRPTIQDAYNSIQIEFANRANSYNPEIVEARDQNAVENYGLRQEGPQGWHFVTQQVIASAMAQTRLSRATFIRNMYDFTVTNRYILLEPMDVVTLTDSVLGLSKTPVRIKTIEEQNSGDLKISAEEIPFGVSSPTLYPKQPVTSSGPQSQAQPGPVNVPVIFEAVSRLNQQLGYQVVFGISGASPNWGGCHILASTDGNTYKQIGTFQSKSRMGLLTSTLPVASDPDTGDTFGVDLSQSNASILSGTQADCDSLRTLCYVDGELISYQTATLTAPNKYNIGTRLRRGVFSSPISSHVVGAQFLRLDDNTFTWEFDATLIGTTIFFKFTSFNLYQLQEEPASTVPVYSITLLGSALGLLTPGHVTYRPLSNPLTAHNSGLAVTDSFNRESLVQAVASNPINGASVIVGTSDGAKNVIPDANGNGGTWGVNSQLSYDASAGNVPGTGGWFYKGTGVVNPAQIIVASLNFNIIPGTTYTLSGFIDATHVTSGAVNFEIDIPAGGLLVGGAQAVAVNGTAGRFSATFSAPSSWSGSPHVVCLIIIQAGALVPVGQLVTLSNPQLELGSVATSYIGTIAIQGPVNLVPDSNGTQLSWTTNTNLPFSSTGGAVAGGKWVFTAP